MELDSQALLALKEMGEVLACKICGKTCRKTASLPCNHHFCHVCIVSYMDKTAACPTCGVPVWKRDVRENQAIANVVRLFIKMREFATPVNDKSDEEMEDSQVSITEDQDVSSSSKRKQKHEPPSSPTNDDFDCSPTRKKHKSDSLFEDDSLSDVDSAGDWWKSSKKKTIKETQPQTSPIPEREDSDLELPRLSQLSQSIKSSLFTPLTVGAGTGGEAGSLKMDQFDKHLGDVAESSTLSLEQNSPSENLLAPKRRRRTPFDASQSVQFQTTTQDLEEMKLDHAKTVDGIEEVMNDIQKNVLGEGSSVPSVLGLHSSPPQSSLNHTETDIGSQGSSSNVANAKSSDPSHAVPSSPLPTPPSSPLVSVSSQSSPNVTPLSQRPLSSHKFLHDSPPSHSQSPKDSPKSVHQSPPPSPSPPSPAPPPAAVPDQEQSESKNGNFDNDSQGSTTSSPKDYDPPDMFYDVFDAQLEPLPPSASECANDNSNPDDVISQIATGSEANRSAETSRPVEMDQSPDTEPPSERPVEMDQSPDTEPPSERPAEMDQSPDTEPPSERPADMDQSPDMEPPSERPAEMDQSPDTEPPTERPAEMDQSPDTEPPSERPPETDQPPQTGQPPQTDQPPQTETKMSPEVAGDEQPIANDIGDVDLDVFGSLPSSAEACESSNIEEVPLVTFSGFNRAQKGDLKRRCIALGIRTSKPWCDQITHLVAKSEDFKTCDRTWKYLMAVVSGKWTVSTKWIDETERVGEIVDPAPFELSTNTISSNSIDVVSGGLVSRMYAKNQFRLFGGMTFYSAGEMQRFQNIDELRKLIVAGGGKFFVEEDLENYNCSSNISRVESQPLGAMSSRASVCSDPDCWCDPGNSHEPCPKVLILVSHNFGREEAVRLKLEKKIKVISTEWLLDSVTRFHKQKITNYLIE